MIFSFQIKTYFLYQLELYLYLVVALFSTKLRKNHICEIKYYKEQFEISKDYEERLQNKLNRFAKETKTNKSLLLTMITANGIKHNSHSDIVQKEIVLEDLFK